MVAGSMEASDVFAGLPGWQPRQLSCPMPALPLFAVSEYMLAWCRSAQKQRARGLACPDPSSLLILTFQIGSFQQLW